MIRFLNALEARTAFVIITIYCASVIISSIIVQENFEKLLLALGRSPSLTGRADLWRAVIMAIEQRPIFGYGYSGFWQTWRGENNPAQIVLNQLRPDFPAFHAHNGFLDIWINIGIVGLAIFALVFLKNLADSIYLSISFRKSIYNLPSIFLLYLVMSNISETDLLNPGFTWFCFILITTRMKVDLNNLKSFQL
jgi:O-antigen ligase